MGSEPVLAARGLVKHFATKGGRAGSATVRAVDGVDLELAAGSTLALVGESGSGKSTVARLITRLTQADAGEVLLDGTDLLALGGRALRRARPAVQMVFQEPRASLDPQMTARSIVGEPWAAQRRFNAAERRSRAADALLRVGLPPDRFDRRPSELSGGECQRVAIARAFATEPSVVVLDEPLSALDVSIRARLVELMRELQVELGTAYLLISHDLAVVEQFAHSISVMYLGEIVETGPVGKVLDAPAHPYTQALVSAVPVPDPTEQRRRRGIVLSGDPPSAVDPPSGCRFRTRCWRAAERCAAEKPRLVGSSRAVACHFPGPGTPQR